MDLPWDAGLRAAGLLGTVLDDLSQADFGIPFVEQFFTIETAAFAENVFWLAVIGLSLNEAAYMAEIVRGGIQSVDEGRAKQRPRWACRGHWRCDW